MTTLIVGPSNVGKSTLLESEALDRFVEAPSREVIFGYELRRGAAAMRDAPFVHYNLAHALLQEESPETSDRNHPLVIRLQEEPIFRALVDSGRIDHALVLVASVDELIENARGRQHRERSVPTAEAYDRDRWIDLLRRADLFSAYEELFFALEKAGVSYDVIHSSPTIPERFRRTDRVFTHWHLRGRVVTPPTEEEVDRVRALPGCGYQAVQLPGGATTVRRGYGHLGGTREASFRTLFAGPLVDASLLDIGCANGDFLFRAERCGANRLVGVEVNHDRCEAAREIGRLLRSSAEFKEQSLFEADLAGPFDVVLALNVIHHVRDVDGFLEKAASLTGRRLILEFPTLHDPKFASLQTEALPEGMNDWPVIGVSDPGVDQTYVFTPSAIERIVMRHIGGFLQVERKESPLEGRAILVFTRCESDEVTK